MRSFAAHGVKLRGLPAWRLKRALAAGRGARRIENNLTGDLGKLVNVHGFDFIFHHYERYAVVLRKPIFEFTLHELLPLTFIDDRGRAWRPDRHFFTDGGSVPKCLQWAFDPLDALPGYIFHDAACLHGGLWCMEPGGYTFEFHKLGRYERDAMLYAIQEICGMGRIKRDLVWCGVRAFALVTGQWD